ncbi:MAG: hypothetical protein QOG70_2513 [Solirubrobacteraceae bacterium]|nr:hypothetical protein [Solirubrobacteraceae bacterium]
MPPLPLADCSCDTVCPTAPDCTCIGIITGAGSVRCCCTCSLTMTPLTREVLKAEDQINLNVRDTELGAVAEFVHQVTNVDILIPVSALRKRVTVSLERVTFADALQEVGLVLGPSQDSGY